MVITLWAGFFLIHSVQCVYTILIFQLLRTFGKDVLGEGFEIKVIRKTLTVSTGLSSREWKTMLLKTSRKLNELGGNFFNISAKRVPSESRVVVDTH